jgi:MFS transporter, DHA2 family, methylenomycin A resistance protein
MVALAAVCLGFFVIQLDVTIVNVALPTIQREIGGTVAGLQWVLDAYTLALASIMLTAGSAADRLGARRVFLAGLSAFAAGSAACAAAPDLGALVAARTVQGLGAAALLPCSLSLIVHQFPDRRARARALGVWGGMGSLGVALGPVVGGALIALWSWRGIFLVNVPVCALTGWLLVRFVAESEPDPGRRADLPGTLLAVVSLAGLTAAFIEAGRVGWLAPLPDALGAVGLVAAVCFVIAERLRASPMLPLQLFRSRAFSAATGVGVLFNLSLYGVLICISLFLQQARHESALATGVLILPFSLAVGVGSTASGWITGRAGPRWPMISGLSLAAAGAVLLSLVGTATPLGLLIAGSVVLGLVSLAMPAMTAVVVGSAGREHSGVASGVLNAARQAGGALGVALLGALLAGRAAGTGGGGPGHGLDLRIPMLVAAAALLLAVGLAWVATRPDRDRALQLAGQPGVHLGNPVLEQREVPVVVEQPRVDAGDVRGEPLAVPERHEHVLAAVHDQHRHPDVGELESPRQVHAAVFPPALTAQRQAVLHGRGEEFGQLAG